MVNLLVFRFLSYLDFISDFCLILILLILDSFSLFFSTALHPRAIVMYVHPGFLVATCVDSMIPKVDIRGILFFFRYGRAHGRAEVQSLG